jgi:hypothetical protein
MFNVVIVLSHVFYVAMCASRAVRKLVLPTTSAIRRARASSISVKRAQWAVNVLPEVWSEHFRCPTKPV